MRVVSAADIMYVSLNILAKNKKFKKLRHSLVDEGAINNSNVFLSSWQKQQQCLPVSGKPSYIFACESQDLKNMTLTLTVN